MPRTESLDELIARKAAEFADEMEAVAAVAANEEEIRIAVETRLAFIQQQVGIKLEGHYEFTVASGRIDAVYSRVIIEYKNPRSTGDRIGPSADAPGSKKVVEQIKRRFYDMRTGHGQPLNSLFGVGFDGKHFIFVRFRDDKWHVQEPAPISRHSAERFLWALFNLGHKGRPFSPPYLAAEFGSEAKLAQDGIRSLYETIVETDHPKAQTFFNQWKILFGEVCGYDVDDPSEKIRTLGKFYGVPTDGLKPAELLFAVHTYYALFMKLLASEIVAFFHQLPTPLERIMSAGTSAKLKREMEELEAGGIFRHLNITNFLEGDLFAWYTSAWTDPIEELIRDMVARLDEYNPGTLSEDPEISRDLVKRLYHDLFPKSVRHDLGEYYTPDWLAEHVLSELKYIGDPDKRLLDPACGSGTFLIMAINRIRQWFDENRENCRFDEGDLCRKILSNVIGFDLNPLAVMAARTNYLIAIRDLIGHVAQVELPVYLCDSLLCCDSECAAIGIGPAPAVAAGRSATVPVKVS
jgi:SAM-dependent methyltransferase